MEQLVLVTKQELSDVVNEAVKAALESLDTRQASKEKEDSTLIYGINGLAQFLGVSMPTAQKYKNDRIFPVYQHGRTLMFKSSEVLAGMSKKKCVTKK